MINTILENNICHNIYIVSNCIDIKDDNLIIHVLTPGENIYEIYLKIQQHYAVSKIIILQDNNAKEEVIRKIDKVKDDCKLRSIDCEPVIFDPSIIESEILAIIEIRKKYPDAELYFNITAGKKDFAIMAFMASVWVNGICYYCPKEQQNPTEFPIPKISVQELAGNKLHLEIIKVLLENEQLSQSKINSKIGTNPNRNTDLSPQTLSQSIKYLKRSGLVNIKREGRVTWISLTLAGKLAYSMINIG